MGALAPVCPSREQGMNCGRQHEYAEVVLRLAASSGGLYYHASSAGAPVQCHVSDSQRTAAGFLID